MWTKSSPKPRRPRLPWAEARSSPSNSPWPSPSALDRLTVDQREAVVLKIYQGFKFEEMAEILSCPGFHHQVPPLHRARTPQDRAGSHEGKRFVMSCSPFDLKEYFLRELPSPQRVPGGSPRQNLSSLPRRAGAPAIDRGGSLLLARRRNSAAHRFRQRPDFRALAPAPLVQRLLGIHGPPGIRLRCHAFRVVFYFAATRPAPAPERTAAPTMAAVSPSPQEIQQQIQQAVSKAVAAVEARQAETSKQLVADFERRNDETLRSIRWMAGEFDADAQARPGHQGDGHAFSRAKAEKSNETRLRHSLVEPGPGVVPDRQAGGPRLVQPARTQGGPHPAADHQRAGAYVQLPPGQPRAGCQ